MLKNKDILDEKDKRLRQMSKEVTFPLDEKDKKTIDLMIEYLTNSQIEELEKKYNAIENGEVETAIKVITKKENIFVSLFKAIKKLLLGNKEQANINE